MSPYSTTWTRLPQGSRKSRPRPGTISAPADSSTSRVACLSSTTSPKWRASSGACVRPSVRLRNWSPICRKAMCGNSGSRTTSNSKIRPYHSSARSRSPTSSATWLIPTSFGMGRAYRRLDAGRARGEFVRDFELLDRQHRATDLCRRLVPGGAGRLLALFERGVVLPERDRHRPAILVVDEDVAAGESVELLDLLGRLSEGVDCVLDAIHANFVTCNACLHGAEPYCTLRCRSVSGGPTTGRRGARRTRQAWRCSRLGDHRARIPGTRLSHRLPAQRERRRCRGGCPGRLRQGLSRARPFPPRLSASALAAAHRLERGAQQPTFGRPARCPRAARGRCRPPGGRGPVPRGGFARRRVPGPPARRCERALRGAPAHDRLPLLPGTFGGRDRSRAGSQARHGQVTPRARARAPA